MSHVSLTSSGITHNNVTWYNVNVTFIAMLTLTRAIPEFPPPVYTGAPPGSSASGCYTARVTSRNKGNHATRVTMQQG